MELHKGDSSNDESNASPAEVKLKRRRITRRRRSSSTDYSTDTSIEIISMSRCSNRHNTTSSSSEDEENESSVNNNNPTTSPAEWSDPIGKQPQLTPFAGTPGFKLLNQNYKKIEDIYALLINDEILEMIVDETNRYAEQLLSKKTSMRLKEWRPTDKNELRKLFGLIMWMGIVRLPEIRLYWSKDPAYEQAIPSSIMSRNRFELVLRMVHFCDNENTDGNVDGDRLYKIRVLVDTLNANFQKYCDPSEMLGVNESLIQGRVTFNQSTTKQIGHKYDIKIVKLCAAPGYTIAFQIYCDGKESRGEKTTPARLVMALCRNIFGKGHTLCTDDWCTSIELATNLLAENTHLIGTMRSNRRGIPKDVVAKQLKRHDYIAKENTDGLTVLKWNHKHDVTVLSTKHSDETIVVRKKGSDLIKPKVLIDYEEGQSQVNVSNQMTSYNNPLRKSGNWYTKTVFELFLNTAVVNAWILYNSVTHNKLSGLEFRKQLAMHLMSCSNNDPVSIIPKGIRHEIKKKEGNLNSVRRRCRLCYQNNVKRVGSQLARNSTITVATFCDNCPDKPHFCLPCFNEIHRNMPL